MASKINIGAAIALDGESEYKQALKNIASEQKIINIRNEACIFSVF